MGEGGGKKVTAILRHSSSRGLCTPEVKIASVSVSAFTGTNIMASRNLQIREEEQLLDRPEPAQIARNRNILNVILTLYIMTRAQKRMGGETPTELLSDV